ncbi:MAG: site-specific integrase [Ktedonobacteraceae bacterium]
MRQLYELRVVVASPGDVKPERDVVKVVATELNQDIAAEYGLYIRISRWETDAFPGFHAEGPQGLIDLVLQIEDCDLLIGIFWKRFGTPTADAKSGTEHEFRKAYEAWKRNKRPQIMIYFNQKPYTPTSRAEIDQWGQVLDFKSDFPQEGLWCTYNSKIEFEKLLRQHLTQFIRRISKTDGVLFGRPQNNLSNSINKPAHDAPSIDEQVSLWLKARASNSPQTKKAYEDNIREFREVLHENRLDLDSEDEVAISSLAKGWAKTSKRKKEVEPRTHNQRLSALSSFYKFAREQGWIINNPIEKVPRLKEPDGDSGVLLDFEKVKIALKSIDRSHLLGKRDYALISILYETERPVNEVKALRCGDITRGESNLTLTFQRGKGGKTIPPVTVPNPAAEALIDYLVEVYGNEWPPDAPVWVSCSNSGRGKAIGYRAIAGVCEKYLDITKVDRIRLSIAAMRRERAKEIAEKFNIF